MNDTHIIDIHIDRSKNIISTYIHHNLVSLSDKNVELEYFDYGGTPLRPSIQSFLNKQPKQNNTYVIPAVNTLDFFEYISKQYDEPYLQILCQTIPVLYKSSQPLKDLKNIYIYKKHDVYTIKKVNDKDNDTYMFMVENKQKQVYCKTIETDDIEHVKQKSDTSFEKNYATKLKIKPMWQMFFQNYL